MFMVAFLKVPSLRRTSLHLAYVGFKMIPGALHKAVQKRHELRILRVISLKCSKNLAKPTFSESFVFKHK